MTIYHEPRQRVSVRGRFDVIVCGGGPAGVTAALSASQSGCTVLLLERASFLGGSITQSGVINWIGGVPAPFCSLQRPTVKLLSRVFSKDQFRRVKSNCNRIVPIDPERFKLESLKLLVDAGVSVLFERLVSRAIKKGTALKGLVAEGPKGREAFLSKLIIDATGSGSVAHAAGAESWQRSVRQRLPSTLIFRVGGVDMKILKRRIERNTIPSLNPLCRRALRELDVEKISLFPAERSDQVYVNMTKIRTEEVSNGKSQLKLRLQAERIMRFLKEEVGGFEKSYVLETEMSVGIREGRRIKCLSTFGSIQAILPKNGDSEMIPSYFFVPNKEQDERMFFISPKCMIPRKVSGLLVTGRCISSTPKGFHYIRGISTAMSLGESTGRLAARLIKEN